MPASAGTVERDVAVREHDHAVAQVCDLLR